MTNKCQNITLIQSYQTSDNASVLQLNQGQCVRGCLQRICPQSEWVARWDASDKSQLMNKLRLQGGAITGGKKSMCCQGVTLPLAVASIAEMTNVSNAMWHMMNQSIQSNETKQTRNKKSFLNAAKNMSELSDLVWRPNLAVFFTTPPVLRWWEEKYVVSQTICNDCGD